MKQIIAILFFLGTFSISSGKNNSDINIIRQRILSEYLQTLPDKIYIETLMNTIKDDGSWPGINYTNLATNAYENRIHVSNIRRLCIAYRNPSSSFFENEKLGQTISKALDYWITHDYIADNWHTNEISNPMDWACILLIMDKGLTTSQINEIYRMASRANLDAWGARPGGDRIKIAGIMAELAVFRKDEEMLRTAVQAMADQIKISSGLGIKPDLNFHHRTDRVTSILAYGTGYAGAFADWAVRLAGTQYNFPENTYKLIIDYYLDGICKSMVHGKYDAPGLLNRDMSRKGALKPVNANIPEKLIHVSDYRKKELENIINIREGKQSPNLSYNQFFYHSEYMIHQRPGYYASVRMYSDRNYSMEYPHNLESLKHHHYGDGAVFISRTGEEHYDIFPVWDWQKIPGTTVVQKPELPHWNQIVKKGKTGFVGAASDGQFGAAAFDFDSPHDPLKARKAWFFFNDEYVCLGTGIYSESEYPVATTLNQCLLNGNVVVKEGTRQHSLDKNEHHLKQVSWIHHDGIAYLFRSPVDVSIRNKQYSGYWNDIAKSAWTNKESEVKKELFTVWIDHGKKPDNVSYEYIVAPGLDLKKADQYLKSVNIQTLSNSSRMQAVYHPGLNRIQAVFYNPGELKLPGGLVVSSEQAGIVLLQLEGKEIKQITVADPSRKLKLFKLKVSGRFEGTGDRWKAAWNKQEKASEILAVLPQEGYAGESLVLTNNTTGLSGVNPEEFLQANEPVKNNPPANGKHYIGENYGGGIVFWVDESGDHGLIAAREDITGFATWRNGPSNRTQHFGNQKDVVTNARADGIYAGSVNTPMIISQLTADNYAGKFAARVCTESTISGYGDWYLPSKTELWMMYKLKDLIGGFDQEMYWSSTEYNVGFAWVQNFQGYGGQYSQNKSSAFAIRCIRRF